MDFDFSDDQKFMKEQARKFLKEQCDSRVARGVLNDPARGYDADLWRRIAGMGWLGIPIAEQHGGLGLGQIALCAIAEEIGRACAPVPFASTVYFFTQAVLLAGSSEQQAALLPAVAAGDLIGAWAVAEGAGVAAPGSALGCRVEGGRLSGVKVPVTDGAIADRLIVLAQEGGQAGLYLVDARGGGVQAETLASLDPTRNVARVTFDGAPAERLGDAGDGWALAQAVLDRAAVLLAFEQVGGTDACLEMAKDYALNRYAFGRVIGGNQAIKHKLADIYVKGELARSNAYFGAWALEEGGAELPLAAAAARIAGSEAYWFAAKENIQTHGGMGFTWEADCHLHYRRSEQLRLVAGAPRLWKERLISQLEQRNAA